MDVEDKSKQNSKIITNILPYLQGNPSSRRALNVKQVNEAQSLKIPKIVFIEPYYYLKHRCVKENLDPILEHQMKCESMKACKSTQVKYMRCSFQFQIQIFQRSNKIPGNPCNASFLCCTFHLHLNAHSQRIKQQAKQASTRYAIYIQIMQNQGQI